MARPALDQGLAQRANAIFAFGKKYRGFQERVAQALSIHPESVHKWEAVPSARVADFLSVFEGECRRRAAWPVFHGDRLNRIGGTKNSHLAESQTPHKAQRTYARQCSTCGVEFTTASPFIRRCPTHTGGHE